MATKNGSWGWVVPGANIGWRSVLVYTTSQTDTTYTINATLQLQCVGDYGIEGSTVKGTLAVGDSTDTRTMPTSQSYGPNNSVTIITKSRTYTKGASVQSVTVSGRVDCTDVDETSTVSQTFSIPKRTYDVKYSVNGGDTSSAPASQKKVQGETLKLSSTIPTRAGCTFLGWNTTKTGTGTHYEPGANYTANAALTLYAIWLGVSVPTIEVERTDAEGLEADEGTYGTVAASWQALGSVAGTVAVTARNATASSAIELSGNTSGSFAAGKSASGNVASAQPFGGSLSTDSRYRIVVTATVTSTYNGGSTVTATATAYIGYAYITMDFRVGGHGVSFGKAAVRDGFDVAMTPIYLAEPPRHDTDRTVTSIPSVIEANTSNATITGVATRTWGKVLMLTVNWTNVNEIAVSATGNIADLNIGTLVEGMRPVMACGGMSHGNNAGQELYYVSANGVITLCSMEGTGESRTVAAGTAHNMHAIFILP